MSLLRRTALLMTCHCHQQTTAVWQGAAASCMFTSLRTPYSYSALSIYDKIVMKGMVFHGYHGALPEENVLGQKFVVDATLWSDISRSGRTDQLEDTVDYSKVYNKVKQIVEGAPRALQEAVAEDIAQQLLQLDPRVQAVQLYIRKPQVALPGVLESVGIEILRRKLDPRS